jgi:hypothetical protein
MKIPKLSSGIQYGIDAAGNRICTGAQMGRRNSLPADRNATVKLALRKLKLVDYDYDQGGAYWGFTKGTAIYRAFGWVNHGETNEETVEMFVRAKSRRDAKDQVLESLPEARFFN